MAGLTDATIASMPMRERRAAHVRPRPPSSDRLRTQAIRADPPPHSALRRYGPIRSGTQIPAPMAFALVGGCIVLGLADLTVGAGLVTGLVGRLASAFGHAVEAHVTGTGDAAAVGSGPRHSRPRPPPDSDGYTNQTPSPIQGSVPAAALGKSGYAVDVYRIGKDGARQQVASVAVGATTRFTHTADHADRGQQRLRGHARYTRRRGPAVADGDLHPGHRRTPKITVDLAGVRRQGRRRPRSTYPGQIDPGISVTIRNEQAPGGAMSNQTVGSDGKFKLTVPVVAGAEHDRSDGHRSGRQHAPRPR